MSKTSTLFILVAAMFVWPGEACKCRVLPDPAYCRTDFLGLLKVTSATTTTTADRTKEYGFELIRDLTRPSTGHSLKEFVHIETNP